MVFNCSTMMIGESRSADCADARRLTQAGAADVTSGAESDAAAVVNDTLGVSSAAPEPSRGLRLNDGQIGSE